MDWKGELDTKGFCLIPKVLNNDELISLQQLFDKPTKESGIRNLVSKYPKCIDFTQKSQIQEILNGAQLVRSLLFDKHSERNWQVNYHQDLTIAIKDKHELDSFGPWTLKEGIHSVQAPNSVLKQIISLRLHLDNCDENNGALKVYPGSHLEGKIPQEDILKLDTETYCCNAKAGDLLLIRPLLVHGSSKALEPKRRRVIHLEYSFCELPQPLQWYSNA